MLKMLGVICITINDLEINNFFRVVNMMYVPCEFAIFGSKIVQYAMVAMMVVVAKQPKSMAQKNEYFFHEARLRSCRPE